MKLTKDDIGKDFICTNGHKGVIDSYKFIGKWHIYICIVNLGCNSDNLQQINFDENGKAYCSWFNKFEIEKFI